MVARRRWHRREGSLARGAARLVVALALAAALLAGSVGGDRAVAAHVPRFTKVAVLFLENRGYTEIIGSRQAPYLNRLARNGALATRYYAVAFAYSEQVGEGATARSHLVGFGALRRDLRRGTVPRFSWITPDLLHDGHNASVRASDRFAARVVPRIVRALGPGGVLFVTWDESQGVTGPRGGRVALIATGPGARRHVRAQGVADHYSLLATLEAGLRLPALGKAAAASTQPLAALLERG